MILFDLKTATDAPDVLKKMNRLQLLDYGRFFAALSVVAFHYLFNGIYNGKISSITHIPEVIDIAKYGYLGVEFFFMISGYVIFFSAKHRTASAFAVSRAVRLYPAFLMAVIFTSCFAFFWGGEQMSVHLVQIFANFTMLAPFLGQEFVDGVYWTLIYELEFYVLVFIILFLGGKQKLDILFLAWPFMIAIATYFNKGDWLYLGNYFCYFAAGALFAIVKERKRHIPSYISLFLSLLLCVYFSANMAIDITNSTGVARSEYIVGTIIILFFAFFMISNTKRASSLNLPGSQLLGALTYPVYLIHAQWQRQ